MFTDIQTTTISLACDTGLHLDLNKLFYALGNVSKSPNMSCIFKRKHSKVNDTVVYQTVLIYETGSLIQVGGVDLEQCQQSFRETIDEITDAIGTNRLTLEYPHEIYITTISSYFHILYQRLNLYELVRYAPSKFSFEQRYPGVHWKSSRYTTYEDKKNKYYTRAEKRELCKPRGCIHSNAKVILTGLKTFSERWECFIELSNDIAGYITSKTRQQIENIPHGPTPHMDDGCNVVPDDTDYN